MMYVGVDGCRAGWFSIGINEDGQAERNVDMLFSSVWQRYGQEALILVDMPIGLPDGSLERGCDLVARQYLGTPRSSSVFPTPCREALQAETYKEANAFNRAVTGRGISWPAWHITKKMRQVDQFLQQNIAARGNIREVHPEVLFWALNGSQSMQYHKKKAAGFRERLDLLLRHFPDSETLVNAVPYPRRDVARDDIVDALVAAITAYCSKGNLQSIPEEPEYDETALPKEMVYWVANKASIL